MSIYEQSFRHVPLLFETTVAYITIENLLFYISNYVYVVTTGIDFRGYFHPSQTYEAFN